jgi:hypothetical protein
VADIPEYTKCTGGYVTVQPLDDGRLLIESWRLNLAPTNSSEPRTDPFGHWITADPAKAAAMIAEFVADLARFANRTTA